MKKLLILLFTVLFIFLMSGCAGDYEEKYNTLKEDYDLLEYEYDELKNDYDKLKDDNSFLEDYSNDLAGFLEELERDYPEIYDKIGAYQ